MQIHLKKLRDDRQQNSALVMGSLHCLQGPKQRIECNTSPGLLLLIQIYHGTTPGIRTEQPHHAAGVPVCHWPSATLLLLQRISRTAGGLSAPPPESPKEAASATEASGGCAGAGAKATSNGEAASPCYCTSLTQAPATVRLPSVPNLPSRMLTSASQPPVPCKKAPIRRDS